MTETVRKSSYALMDSISMEMVNTFVIWCVGVPIKFNTFGQRFLLVEPIKFQNSFIIDPHSYGFRQIHEAFPHSF